MVVLLFLICWGPRLLLNAIIKWGLSSYNETVYQLRIYFYLMPFVHSCINPIIYRLTPYYARQVPRISLVC